MRKPLLFLMMFCSTSCFAMNWDEILTDYQFIIPEESTVQKQYQAYILSEAPTIADNRIKEIPICENDEELIDLKFMAHDRIQMLPSPSTPFEAACFNSGLPSASKIRLSVFNKLEKMLFALDEIANYFGYEPNRIHIKVFEGLRDLDTQQMLFQKKLQEILSSDPNLKLEMAEQETAKWVSPYKNNVPVHSTGAAIDIRLWDSKVEDFLDMGTFGVIWGKNDHASTFSEHITDDQKRNRLYCLIAAELAGLTNYVYEFWHFSFGDRYDAYWKKNEEKKALYGPINK